MNFKLKSVTLHHIDFENETVEQREINKKNAEEYINKIIKNTIDNEDVRYFRTKSVTTEVVGLLYKLMEKFDDLLKSSDSGDEANQQVAATSINNHIEVANSIAHRLLREEKQAQKNLANLKVDVKKGSLVQSILKLEGNLAYLFAKVEHFNYLDKNDLEIHTGLPVEKVILKTCVITYNSCKEIIDIRIYDSNATIAKYWSEGFLELEEISSNEENTLKSFNSIERFLVRKVKKASPADYSLLRNSLIGYYNQNEGFEYESLVKSVFENYQPEHSEFINMDDIKKGLKELPDKGKFERKFEIVPKIIRARKRRVISINPNIDLTIKDKIENMKGIIQSIKEPNNDLYIKIKVDESVFNEFNFNE